MPMKRIKGVVVTGAVVLGALLALPCDAYAKTTVAKLFSDGMVLQRQMAVPVWGWAEAGEKVTVGFAGQEKSAVAGADGAWMVKLDVMEASAEGRELVVKGVDGKGVESGATLKDVLVGEVWLCGGQSNMGLTLSEVFHAKEEIAKANYPLLRLMAVGAGPSPAPMKDIRRSGWKVCTPESAAHFAATAYFFGKKVQEELKIPVGLVEFDIGATGIEGWTPIEGFKSSKDPAMQAIYREVMSWDPTSEIGKKAIAEGLEKVKAWVPEAKKALAAGKPVPPQPLLPAAPVFYNGPTVLFNGTVSAVVPFAVRGAVWYQGEANPGEGASYEAKMRAMISGWRQVWGQGDFPFYYVQLTNEGKPVELPDGEEWFRYVPVREAQRRVMDMPNTGMVVGLDLGEDASGHPRNKRDVGYRLALWALGRDYGKKVAYTGPRFKEAKFEGGKAIVSFTDVGGGLVEADKDGQEEAKRIYGLGSTTRVPLGNFSLRGKDGKWHWATGMIEGDTVVVTSKDVPEPVAVRYAYSMNPKGPKLYNIEGLPASGFWSEAWPVEKK
jgi:sialate O-acetylesterase